MRQGAFRSITWMIVLFMILLTGSLAKGQGAVPAEPGWHLVSAPPVSPDEARQIISNLLVVPLEVAASETEATPEIQALARGLRNDPKLMFDYVHNNIEYVPAYGLAKDATATLLAGRGNDLEQAALLVALLRAAGFTANFVTGDVVYEVSRLANWLGVSPGDPNVMSTVLTVFGNGGVPVQQVGVTSTVQVTRAWVRATILAQIVDLDPAMKEYREIAAGVNVASASGYNRTTFLNDAQAGATVTADYITNANQANVRADLTTWSTNLITYIRSNLPAASVAEVIGGREVIGTEMASYPTSLPYALSVTNTDVQTSVPDSLCHTLRLQYAGFDKTFRTYEVTGRRVTIFHRSADLIPELRVDGTVVATGTTAVAAGTARSLTVTIDHPYSAFGGTFADQQGTMSLLSGSSYCVMHDFGVASGLLISRRNERLGASLAAGTSLTSEEVLGESLSIMGLTWFQEERLFTRLIDRLGKVVAIPHHRLGIVGQDEGYFFDIPMSMTAFPKREASGDGFTAFRALSMMASAFEHGVLEQLQGETSVSTVRAIERAVALGQKIFLAKSSNWAANVKPNLIGYSPAQLASFEADLADPNQQYVLTENRLITLNQWQGTGWIGYYFDGSAIDMQMIIAGGYAGGRGTTKLNVDPSKIQSVLDEWFPPIKKFYTPKSGEPVDMVTGAYLSSNTDLAIGGGDPLGLAFARMYTSSGRYSLRSLGYGWNHGYSMSATTISDGDAGLGSRTPVDAAPLILFTHVLIDLLQGTIDVVEWTVADLTSEWAMDMLTSNAVSVRVGTSSLSFVALPDGSFNPPPGQGHQLIKDGAGWHLSDTIGTRIDFDNNGRAITRRDTNDNTQTFAYDGSSRLQTVTCDTGLSFTLAYTGSLLTGVTDSAGRSISYIYTGNLLTAFRDALGNQWGYEYGAGNFLTKVFKADPATQALVTNTYDGLGRVISQTDGLGRTGEFFYGGTRNVERFPDGTEVIYSFDGLGRFIRRQDPVGKRMEMVYDGQNRMVRATDRLGDINQYAFHNPSSKILSVTNAAGHITASTYTARLRGSFTYYDRTRIDYADGTNGQFTFNANGNVLTRVDRAGKTRTYTYNSRGQVLTATNPTGGVITYTYNAPDATLASSKDSDTGIGTTTYIYDVYKRPTRITHPDTTFIQIAYNLNNQITSITDENNHAYNYQYDANGNLIRITDPASKQTQYAYDLMDQVTQVTDRLSKISTLAYNNMGRLQSYTDPNGIAAGYGYDTRGWLNSITLGGQVWQTGYDDEGIVSSTKTPLNYTTNYQSNKLGFATGITNPLSQTTTMTRDPMSRVTGVTDPLTRTTTYAYDSRGLLSGVTMPVIGGATYSRNDLGRLSQIADLKGSNWIFGYTNAGRLQSETDPLGNTWQYAYDTLGRLSTITYPGGGTATRTYDSAGNIIRLLYSGGPDLPFTYDSLNRPLTANNLALTWDDEGRVTSTDNPGVIFGATYDNGGRLSTATYPSTGSGQAFTVTYTYNATTGLLSRVTDNLTSTQIDFTYDNDRRPTGITRSNGVNTTLTWDNAGRPIRFQDGPSAGSGFIDLQYTLNGAGEVTQANMTVPFDPASLLQSGTENFTYDAASRVSTSGYGYDQMGRQTAAPGSTFAWNDASQLTGINSTTLAYNGLGDLVTRTESGNTIHYYYNYAIGLKPIVAEKNDSTGQFLRYYVWTPGGRLLYMIDAANSNKVYFYHFDFGGSTLALTDSTGAVTDKYAYNSYGKLLSHQGTNQQPFTFLGRWGIRQECPSTGSGCGTLYHIRARYYDAVTQRFLSRDPIWPLIGDPVQLNPYQYGGVDPINRLDITGGGAPMNDLWKYDRGNNSWANLSPTGRTGGSEDRPSMLNPIALALDLAIERRFLILGFAYSASAKDSDLYRRQLEDEEARRTLSSASGVPSFSTLYDFFGTQPGQQQPVTTPSANVQQKSNQQQPQWVGDVISGWDQVVGQRESEWKWASIVQQMINQLGQQQPKQQKAPSRKPPKKRRPIIEIDEEQLNPWERFWFQVLTAESMLGGINENTDWSFLGDSSRSYPFHLGITSD